MMSITISADPTSNDAAASSSVEIDSSSDGTLSERGDIISDNEAEPYVVQVSIIRKEEAWDGLAGYVEKAKSAKAADTADWPGSKVYIDFDPRADLEESEISGLNSLQIAVARALGLDPTKEFFSE